MERSARYTDDIMKKEPMGRRTALGGLAGMLAAVTGSRISGSVEAAPAAVQAPAPFDLSLSEAEWHKRLNAKQFAVLRQHATEPPGSSPLDAEHREGIFACAGCDRPLFASKTKFNSGTGWPSFYQPLPNAVATSTDHDLMIPRTEVHCRRCGSHLGHVFDDGPKPTGLRYCIDGLALRFLPGATG